MTSKLGSKPPSNYPDSHSHMRGYIPATEYATAYLSNHSQNILPGSVLPLLGNLNCDHFSHPGGRAPTLLSLKQHAQALTVLIRHLSISTSMGEIDAAHKDGEARAFEADEAFDWLHDLETAYTNTDPSHNLPLTTLMNQVERQTDVDGPQFHCPLKELIVHEDPAGGDDAEKHRPYSSHHNLLMHASECLEVLDHEYGATGGIMSLLPTDDKEAVAGAGAQNVDMLSARNSLVGQWLLFTQHLVGRMHELETSYGQSLDALAGEAAVPAQLAARAAGGRQVVFPQDKWVLANAGDDVFDYVHRLLDVEEGQHGERERMWRAAGVSGQRMWSAGEERAGGGGGEEFSRGIVALDLVTRYYRLKGSGKSTVFVLPAWQVHPRCKSTAEVERQPTVVAVPAPLWPTRVSDWEARNRRKLEEGEAMGAELATVTARVGQQSRQIEFLMDELRKTRKMVYHYEGAFPGNLRSTVEGLETKLDRYRVGLATLRDTLPVEHRGLLDGLDLEKTG